MLIQNGDTHGPDCPVSGPQYHVWIFTDLNNFGCYICKFNSESKVLPVTCHAGPAVLIVSRGARLTWVVNATPRTRYLRE